MSEKPKSSPADSYSIVIPYKDFCEMLESASKGKDHEKRIKRLEEQLGALRGLYSEVLEKFGELKELI